MNDNNKDMNNFQGNSESSSANAANSAFSAQLVRVYGWMFFGMLMTAGIAYYTAVSSLKFLALNPIAYIVLIIMELGLVWFLSRRALTMKYENAAAAFVVYSGLNGLTLSVIFFRYQLGSIALVFVVTAVFFGSMSLYGLMTKQDLSHWGPLLMAGLVTVIIATIFNIFMKNDTFMIIVSYIGVAVFLGLTAYDTKKIKEISNHYAGTDKEKNIAILGALSLYLDFINLFLFILRILGRRK